MDQNEFEAMEVGTQTASNTNNSGLPDWMPDKGDNQNQAVVATPALPAQVTPPTNNLPDWLPDKQTPFQKAYAQAAGTNADDNAKAVTLSKQTGYPPVSVAADLPAAQKAADTLTDAKLKEIEAKNPQLAEYLAQRPELLAQVHDDIPNLQEHANIFKQQEKPWLQAFANILRVIGDPGEFDPSEQTPQEYAEQKANSAAAIGDKIDEYAEKLPTPDLDAPFFRDPHTAATHLLGMVPALAEGLIAEETGGPVAVATVFGTTAKEEKQAELIKVGIPEDQARLYATGVGAISGATAIIPMGIFKKQFTALANTYGDQAARATMKQVFLEMAQAGHAMGAQNVANQNANDFVDYVSGANPHAMEGEIGKLVNAYFEGAAGGVATAGTMHGLGMTYKSGKDLYKKISDAATDSKLQKRNPEAYADTVGDMAKGTPAAKVVVNKAAFDKYFQEAAKKSGAPGADPKSVADWLKAGSSWEESEATNGLLGVEVPVEEWFSKLAGKPAIGDLKDDVKWDQNDLTANEWDGLYGEKSKEVAGAATEAAQETPEGQPNPVEEGQTADEQLKGVYKEIAEEIQSVGHPKSIAHDIVEQVRSLAEKQKWSPVAVWNIARFHLFSGDPMPQTAADLGLVNPLDHMIANGDKVLVEKPDTSALTGGALTEAVKRWKSEVASYKDAGIPYTTDPNAKGAKAPADLAQHWFDEANGGRLNRNVLPAEWWDEARSGRPDATHDQIREIIRNSGRAGDVFKKLNDNQRKTLIAQKSAAKEKAAAQKAAEVKPGEIPTKEETQTEVQRQLAEYQEKLKNAQNELERVKAEARTDELTGMLNKRAFLEDAKLGYDGHARVDLDLFKELNEALGHDVVDKDILPRFGVMFQKVAESIGNARAYRFGGDEFDFRAKDLGTLKTVLSKLQQKIKQTPFYVEVVDPQGNTTYHEIKGLGFSFGTGEAKDEPTKLAATEQSLQQQKADRTASGERRARGEGRLERRQLAPDEVEQLKRSSVQENAANGQEREGVVGPEGNGPGQRPALEDEYRKPEPGDEQPGSAAAPLKLKQSPVVPAFYSRLEKTIESKMGNAATADQVRGLIKDMPADERKWSGIDDFLKDNPKPSKTDLLDFLRANQLQIKEIQKGHVEERPRPTQKEVEELGKILSRYDYLGFEGQGPALRALRENPDDWRERWEVPEGADADALQAYVDKTRKDMGTTKFEKYTLPGGENYREILFQMPSEHTPVGGGKTEREPRPGGTFRSSHFEEPDILAHARVDERTDAEGKKVLFVEEVQSDWHQKGRKEGYRDDLSNAQLEAIDRNGYFEVQTKDGKFITNTANSPEIKTKEAAIEEARRRLKEEPQKTGTLNAVPDAPFKKTWHEFVMKRLVREAAEKGFDKIAWTTGEQQAGRYDLSKQIDSLHYTNDGALIAEDKMGRTVFGKSVPEKEIENYVGKEAAKKLLEAKLDKDGERHLDNADLKVGGEGMKGFYDKIIPDFMNKFGKKYGAQVEESKMGSGIGGDAIESRLLETPGSFKVEWGSEEREFPTLEQAKVFREGLKTFKAHSMEITPALRKAALEEGFPLFQGKPGEERGGINVSGDIGNTPHSVYVTRGADKSTILHEAAHAFFLTMDHLVKTGQATKEVQDIYKDLLGWFGVKDSSEVQEQHHEMFAKGTEWVLRGGDIPKDKPFLKRAYHLFRDWLLKTYPDDDAFMKQYFPLQVREMPQEIKDIFVRLRTTKAEVERAAHDAGMFKDRWKDLGPEAAAYIRDQEFEAMARAEDELLKPQMAELTQKHQDFLAKERARVGKEAAKEVDDLPISHAVESLKDLGEPADVADKYFEGDPKTEAAVMGEADRRGYSSPEALARDMKNFNRDAEVARRTEAGMLKYRDMRLTPKIREEAVAKLHDEHMTELLALKAQYLDEQRQANRKEAADLAQQTDEVKAKTRAVNRRRAQQEAQAARAQAQQILANKSEKDSKPGVYITAERKAYGEMVKARAKKDFEKAAQWAKKQVNAHALAAEALKNQKEFAKIDKNLAPWVKRGRDLKGVPYGHAIQIDDVLARAGMKPDHDPEDAMNNLTDISNAKDMEQEGATPMDIADATGMAKGPDGQYHRETLSEFIQRINSDFFPVGLPPEIATLAARDGDNLTLGQKRVLNVAVSVIAANGKHAEKFLAEDIKESLKEMASIAAAHALNLWGVPHAADLSQYKAIAPLPGGQARGTLKVTDATVLRAKQALGALGQFLDSGLVMNNMVQVISLCEAMDGGQDGPWHRAIYRNMSHGLNDKLKILDSMKDDMNALFEKHYGKQKEKPLDYRTHNIEVEPGKVLTKMQILMMLLNRGNQGNLDRLVRGNGFTEDQIRQFTETHLGKHDFDYAQDVWDHFNKYWPKIDAMSKKLLGVEPKKVEPLAFSSKYGEYKGGYFPIVYDFKKSSDAYKTAEQRTELYRQYSAALAHTQHGFTESRVDTLARPLMLDTMDPVKHHLEELAHDMAFREPVIDTARFLRQKPVKQAMEAVLGVQSVKMVNDWLKSVAGIQTFETSGFDRGMHDLRMMATYKTLGLRFVMVPRLLTSNLINMAHDLGPIGLGRAMTDYLMHGSDIDDALYEKFPQLKDRATLRDKAIGDVLDKWAGEKKGWLAAHTFLAESWADRMTSNPLAWHVYQRELKNGTEQRARDMAQEAVSRAVGSGSMLDQIGAQRGGETKKFFTIWGTWNYMMLNRAWRDGKFAQLAYRKGNYAKFLGIVAMSSVNMLAVAAMDQAWQEIFRNVQAQPGPQEDEKRGKRFLVRTLAQTPGYIPVIGPMVEWGASKLAGEEHGDFRFSAIEETLQDLMQSGVDTVKVGLGVKEADEHYWKEMVSDLALVAKKPQTVVNWTFNAWDWMHDEGQKTWQDLIGQRRTKD